jgi:lipoprotein-releasing system permease protein
MNRHQWLGTLNIAFRYTWPHRTQGFFAGAAIAGIAFSVATLLVVLSVYNGFMTTIQNELTTFLPHVTWPSDVPETGLNALPDIVNKRSFAGEPIMASAGNAHHATWLWGVQQPESWMVHHWKRGGWSLQSETCVMGSSLANTLMVSIGDVISAVMPSDSMIPIYTMLRVTGIYQTNSHFGADDAIYTHLTTVTHRVTPALSGQWVQLKNPWDVERLPSTWLKLGVHHWLEQYSTLFRAITTEKTALFGLLLLVMCMAALHLMTGFYWMWYTHRLDISILKTMGVSNAWIMGMMMLQSIWLACIGMCVGDGLGILIANHLTSWSETLGRLLNIEWLPKGMYYVDTLPATWSVHDMLWINIAALCLSVMASLRSAYWHHKQAIVNLLYERS